MRPSGCSVLGLGRTKTMRCWMLALCLLAASSSWQVLCDTAPGPNISTAASAAAPESVPPTSSPAPVPSPLPTLPAPSPSPVPPPSPVPVPVPPVPHPAPVPNSNTSKSSPSCSGGCIAGAVVGGIVGAAVLAGLGFTAWKCFGPHNSPGLSGAYVSNTYDTPAYDYKQQKTVAQPAPAQINGRKPPTPPPNVSARVAGSSTAPFWPGQIVCCRTGDIPKSGRVASYNGGSKVQVRLDDDKTVELHLEDVAQLYQANEKVIYTDPVSGQTRVATVVRSDGTTWPPFYAVKYANEAGLHDTVQQRLKPLRGTQVTQV